MKAIKLSAVLLAIGLFTAAASQASAQTYKVDPVHSTLIFRIHHLDAGYIWGRFNDPTGQFTLDTDDPSKDTFNASVPAKNIDTHIDMRDRDLRGENWLNVKQYPTITFKSTSVKKTDDTHLEVTGDLTLHGTTKSVTAAVEITGTGKGMQGETRRGIEATFTINRHDFGINGKGAGDEVKLVAALEGIQQ